MIGERTIAIPSAIKVENACAVGPKSPKNAATEMAEAINIEPKPTGLKL